jgi:ubiquinone/menaquinone biosynthesis C-methylase UbiE
LDLSPAMCAVAHRRTALPFGAADTTALPIRSGSVAGLACLYAVIHLDAGQRGAAYREFARVLRPGGYALVAFHTSDAEVPAGGARTLTDWWGHEVRLDFRFLEPAAEAEALVRAGFELAARLDRGPYPGVEHPSERTYLLARRH